MIKSQRDMKRLHNISEKDLEKFILILTQLDTGFEIVTPIGVLTKITKDEFIITCDDKTIKECANELSSEIKLPDDIRGNP